MSVLPIAMVVSPTGSGHAWHSARSRCAAVCVCVREREQETEEDRGTGWEREWEKKGVSERRRKRRSVCTLKSESDRVRGLELEEKRVCEWKRTSVRIWWLPMNCKEERWSTWQTSCFTNWKVHMTTGQKGRWINRQPPELFLNLPMGQMVHTAASLER